MGRFLSNIQLINDNNLEDAKLHSKLKKIQEYRDGNGVIIYQVNDNSNWISVYDEYADMYDFSTGEDNPYFSLRMRGIHVMVNDSDELTLVFFKGKSIVGRFFTDRIAVESHWVDKKEVFPETDVEAIKTIFVEDNVFVEDKLDRIAEVLGIHGGSLSLGYDDIGEEEGYQILEAYKPIHYKREFNKIMKNEFTLFMNDIGFELYRYFDSGWNYRKSRNDNQVIVIIDHSYNTADIYLRYNINIKYISEGSQGYYNYYEDGCEGVIRTLELIKTRILLEIDPMFIKYESLKYFHPDESYIEEVKDSPEIYRKKYLEEFGNFPASINTMIDNFKILFHKIKSKTDGEKRSNMLIAAVIYLDYLKHSFSTYEIEYDVDYIKFTIPHSETYSILNTELKRERKYTFYIFACLLSIYYIADYESLYYGMPGYKTVNGKFVVNDSVISGRNNSNKMVE